MAKTNPGFAAQVVQAHNDQVRRQGRAVSQSVGGCGLVQCSAGPCRAFSQWVDRWPQRPGACSAVPCSAVHTLHIPCCAVQLTQSPPHPTPPTPPTAVPLRVVGVDQRRHGGQEDRQDEPVRGGGGRRLHRQGRLRAPQGEKRSCLSVSVCVGGITRTGCVRCCLIGWSVGRLCVPTSLACSPLTPPALPPNPSKTITDPALFVPHKASLTNPSQPPKPIQRRRTTRPWPRPPM